MKNKEVIFSVLLDYYGPLLSEKQLETMTLYYNDDLSLSEIAENMGMSRQGVRDHIKHAENFLLSCEEKLKFSSKLRDVMTLADKISDIAMSCGESENMKLICEYSKNISELLQ